MGRRKIFNGLFNLYNVLDYDGVKDFMGSLKNAGKNNNNESNAIVKILLLSTFEYPLHLKYLRMEFMVKE